jgi:dienelactone hydrolase
MPRLLKFLFCFLLLAAGEPACAAYDAEWVEFPALMEFNGSPVRLRALLFKPNGPGPFPAVVLLHGCGGLLTNSENLTASYGNWADRFAQSGYVALLPDSFNPRGQRSLCEQQKRSILESRERVEDAYAALQWLVRQSYVAGDRVGLIGWSNGASGTLYGMRETQPHRGFRAAVAFYPGCRTLARSKTPYRPYAPLLILAGEADDWTPAAPCVELTKVARQQGAPMEIVTYPGAYHSFDRINSPVRYRPDVRNLNKPDRLGATVGEHPEARMDASRRTLEFFAQNLKGHN